MAQQPESPADWISLGRVLIALGRLREAEEVALRLLDADSRDLTALSMLARIKHMRGELTQAIGLWAEIHARSPHNEMALMQLDVLRRMAQDPEKTAGEFVALTDGRLVRKHVAHLELEEAFRRLAERDVAGAEESCERVARRHRAESPEVYKLAQIARARVRDLAGDLDGARAALEDLGRERGFETDVDRVLFLARIHEQIGKPDNILAAINICRHLGRTFEKISVHARLARLYRLAGDAAAAEESEGRYQRVFQRRMHRPVREDCVRAAGVRFIPLGDLRAVRCVEADDEPPAAGPRAAALRQALYEDPAAASAALGELFSESRDPVDGAYLGEVWAERGETARAVGAWAKALAEGPAPLPELVAHVCGRPEWRAAIQPLLDSPDRLGAAIEDLKQAAHAQPQEPEVWRRLAAVEREIGRGADADRHAGKARAIEEARRSAERPGRVLTAAAYNFLGKVKGVIHELWADRYAVEPGRGGVLDEAKVLGNLTVEMLGSVRNTFSTVSQYARSKFPHLVGDLRDHNYTFKVTKEDEPSGGLSAGLPTAVAFLSVVLDRPVPPDVALSGAIVADAHDVVSVRPVGDVSAKVKGAYHRGLRMLVLPEACREDVERSGVVPLPISRELVRYAATLDETLEHIFGRQVWEW